MDADLAQSLQVDVPSDLMAKLQLNQVMQNDNRNARSLKYYAIAASLAIGLFVAGFMASSQLGLKRQIEEDYQTLLVNVVEHLDEQPVTPVWEATQANETVNALLANYGSGMKLKFMENLQFGRICPMGRYKGLHASLETEDGQVTFAYIKGEHVDQIQDVTYEGYRSRIKPVRGGSMIILSRTKKGVEQADQQLQNAMYWDI
jgi:hypothetical protein